MNEIEPRDMTKCSRTRQVQDFLDGDLRAPEARDFSAHLEACRECGAEMARYTRLFARLRETPVRDPGPALTERVLDHVLPSRLRRRWVTAIGWSYSAASAASTYLFISWITRPETHVWLTEQVSEAYLRLIQTGLFALHALTFSWVRLLQGWGLLATIVERIAPLARALRLPLLSPVLIGTVWAAAFAAAILLWWMRPGRRRLGAGRDGRLHLLGF